ncbi:hypothetical protein [Streptomyces niveus]|uniref:hypothetical protein n=1 Tax=Streptomyces niveus TaxID=193462 RepID=UPI003418B4D7
MTTSSKPRRTMLPPNLTRNYYEAKRLIAEGEGRNLPHWYQLTGQQKAAEDLDVELFRRAILRAEEEQDLVASFNAPPAEPTPPAVGCDCPGCTTVAALADYIARMVKRVASSQNVRPSPGAAFFAGTPVGVRPSAPISHTEHERARKAIEKTLAAWAAAGKPVTAAPQARPAYTLTFDGSPLAHAELDRLLDDSTERRFNALRFGYFAPVNTFPPKV